MKPKFFCRLVILALCAYRPFFLSAQIADSNTVYNNQVYSPGKIFDTVFDKDGNKFSLGQIAIDPIIRQASTSTSLSGSSTALSMVAGCTAGYFQVYYEDGCGMEGPGDAPKREVLCKVLTDISNFIISPCTSTGQKVNIIIKNPGSFSGGAAATSYYYAPNAPGVSGIADNLALLTINSGIDAFTNVTLPLSSTSASIPPGTSAFFHGSIIYNFSLNWNYDLSAAPGAGVHDFYAATLHEVYHMLGFSSLINYNGNSNLGANFPYYSRYDLHLKSGANNLITQASTGCTNGSYGFRFNPALSPFAVLCPGATSASCPDGYTTSYTDVTNCTFPGIVCYANSTFSQPQPVYNPSCFEKGSSLCHFEDMCHVPHSFELAYPLITNFNDQYFVMSNASSSAAYDASTNPGVMKRHPTPEERQVLCDIGYHVNSVFGDATIPNNYCDYGGSSCPGVQVVGICDGIIGGGYSFVTNTGVPININPTIGGLLANDYNASSFKCIEVISGGGDVFPTSGVSSTTVTYTPPLTGHGVTLLRYIPVDASGVEGNITYIYVYKQDPNCPASACNMVPNGGFESADYSILSPTFPYGPYAGLGCWAAYSGTPDLLSRNVSTPLFSLPGPTDFPTLDTRPTSTVDNNCTFMYGQRFPSGLSGVESQQVPLAVPLTPGNTYVVSFWAILPASPGHPEITTTLPVKFQIATSPVAVLPLHSTLMTGLPPGLTTLAEFTINQPDNQWHPYTAVVTYTGTMSANAIIALPSPWLDPVTPAYNHNLYYIAIDDVSISPINEAATLTLPPTLCTSDPPLDLTTGITIPGGTFKWFTTPVTAGVPTVSNSSSFDPLAAYNASIASGGTGVVTVEYTYTDAIGCVREAYASISIGIIPPPITGSTLICHTGDITNLFDDLPAGIWSSSNIYIADVSSTGTVMGESAGTATISYATSAGCYTTTNITVGPDLSPIMGPSTLCLSTTADFTESEPGGTWSANPTSVAAITSSGTLLGTGIGSALVSYTLTNGCQITAPVSVINGPQPITGVNLICGIGNFITLNDVSLGGVWSSSNPYVANVSGGMVTAMSAGTATITYAIGSCYVTKIVNVHSLPLLAITQPAVFCPSGVHLLVNAVGTFGPYSYSWSPTAGIGYSPSATVADPTITSIPGLTNFIVTVTDAAGCQATATTQLAPYPGGSCDPCTVFGSNWSVLSGTLTADVPPGNYYVANDLTINGNVNFNNAVVEIADGVNIFVNPTSSLHLKGSHLFSCSSSMWKGITLLSDAIHNFTGTIELTSDGAGHSTLIEDAITAITLDNPIRAAGGGYYINSTDAIFNRNTTGVSISHYNYSVSAIATTQHIYEFHFENTVFTSRRFNGYSSGGNSYPLAWPNTTGNYGLKYYYNPGGAAAPYTPPYNIISPTAGPGGIDYAPIGTHAGTWPLRGILLDHVGNTTYPDYINVVIGEPSHANIFDFTSFNKQLNMFDNQRIGIEAQNACVIGRNNIFMNGRYGNVYDNAGIYVNMQGADKCTLSVEQGTYHYSIFTTKSPNYFYNLVYGVAINNYFDVNTTNSTFKNLSKGIYIKGKPGNNTNITDNSIVNSPEGIIINILPDPASSISVSNPGTTNVNSNTITAKVSASDAYPGYCATGIYIDDIFPYATSSANPFNTNNNKVVSNVFGIRIEGIQSQTAVSAGNTITLMGVSAAPNNSGIYHNACYNSLVKNNTISSSNSGYEHMANTHYTLGVFMQGCNLPQVQCNTAIGVAGAFKFEGVHAGSKYTWWNNTMINCTHGLVLVASDLGTQGDWDNPSSNRWLHTSTFKWEGDNYHTWTDPSSYPPHSLLFIGSDAPASYTPVNNYEFVNSPSSFDPSFVYSFFMNNGLYQTTHLNMPSAFCRVNKTIPSLPSSTTGNVHIQGQLKQLGWIRQNALWEVMTKDDTLGDYSDTFRTFRAQAAICRYGLFTAIDKALRENRPADAQLLLDTHSIDDLSSTFSDSATGVTIADEADPLTDNIIANYRGYFQAYINLVQNKLDNKDRLLIKDLANDCPLTAGAVVYNARAMYCAINDVIESFDYTCVDSGATDTLQKTGRTGVPNTAGSQYMLYPNPNNGNFILQQALLNDAATDIAIYNAVGKEVLRESVQFINGKKELSLNVAPGLYLVKVRTGNEQFIIKFEVK